MDNELERLASFQHEACAPIYQIFGKPWPSRLSRLGFYFLASALSVVCSDCQISIHINDLDADFQSSHQSRCRFASQRAQIADDCCPRVQCLEAAGQNARSLQSQADDYRSTRNPGDHQAPDYIPLKSELAHRLSTFGNCTDAERRDSRSPSAAGVFCMGQGDLVQSVYFRKCLLEAGGAPDSPCGRAEGAGNVPIAAVAGLPVPPVPPPPDWPPPQLPDTSHSHDDIDYAKTDKQRLVSQETYRRNSTSDACSPSDTFQFGRPEYVDLRRTRYYMVDDWRQCQDMENYYGSGYMSLQEENRTLRACTLCILCLSEPRNTVFVPCGHLVCCNGCSVCFYFCPACGRVVEKLCRAYVPW